MSLGYITHSQRSTRSAPAEPPDPKDRIEVYNLINDDPCARDAKYDGPGAAHGGRPAEPESLVAHFQLGVVYRMTKALDKASRNSARRWS